MLSGKHWLSSSDAAPRRNSSRSPKVLMLGRLANGSLDRRRVVDGRLDMAVRASIATVGLKGPPPVRMAKRPERAVGSADRRLPSGGAADGQAVDAQRGLAH